MTSKSPVSTEVKVPCLACGRECPDGLRYCLYCGGKTLEIDKPIMPVDPHCPKCGEEDELNIAFCVNCGAKLAPDALEDAKAMVAKASSNRPTETRATVAKLAKKTGFNWTLEDSPPPAIRLAMRIENEPSASVPSAPVLDGPNGLMPSVLGMVAGLVVAGMLFATSFLPDIVTKLLWPQSGLVVYCPKDASELQFSFENLESHVITLATVPAPGSTPDSHAPRLLILRDLPKGDYMMRMESAGANAVGLVTLSDKGPTVVGHPSGIRVQD